MSLKSRLFWSEYQGSPANLDICSKALLCSQQLWHLSLCSSVLPILPASAYSSSDVFIGVWTINWGGLTKGFIAEKMKRFPSEEGRYYWLEEGLAWTLSRISTSRKAVSVHNAIRLSSKWWTLKFLLYFLLPTQSKHIENGSGASRTRGKGSLAAAKLAVPRKHTPLLHPLPSAKHTALGLCHHYPELHPLPALDPSRTGSEGQPCFSVSTLCRLGGREGKQVCRLSKAPIWILRSRPWKAGRWWFWGHSGLHEKGSHSYSVSVHVGPMQMALFQAEWMQSLDSGDGCSAERLQIEHVSQKGRLWPATHKTRQGQAQEPTHSSVTDVDMSAPRLCWSGLPTVRQVCLWGSRIGLATALGETSSAVS